MAPPNDSSVFRDMVSLTLLPDNRIELSHKDSQMAVIELEAKVNTLQKEPANAKVILAEVSEWGGNNKLDLILPNNNICKATLFKREWSTGKHATSRLAIYQDSNYVYNRNEYIKTYLPLLAKISTTLNTMGIKYKCAATGETKSWRPVDVEMAAFFWWAKKGDK